MRQKYQLWMVQQWTSVDAIGSVGAEEQKFNPEKFINVLKKVEVKDGEKFSSIRNHFRIGIAS